MTEHSTDPSSSPPEGWYPDTTLPGAERYWDGTAWTEQTRPAAGQGLPAKRSKKGWIIGGSIAAGVVLIAVIVGVALSANAGSSAAAPTPLSSETDGDLVVVPDLIGMTVADARVEVDAVDLTISVPIDAGDEAIIAMQTPSAGREAEPGSNVLVTVELGTESFTSSLSFADGAALDPLAMVGWQFSFGSDDGSWTPSPDAPSGEMIFVNADGTCEAQYWQEVFETTAPDDLSASDEFVAAISGATAEEIETYAFDGHFALGGRIDEPPTEGDVATRTLLWDNDEGSFLLSARVFQNLDYATSTMNNAYSLIIQCDTGVEAEEFADSLDAVAKVSIAQ